MIIQKIDRPFRCDVYRCENNESYFVMSDNANKFASQKICKSCLKGIIIEFAKVLQAENDMTTFNEIASAFNTSPKQTDIHKCPTCGKEFETANQLKGHKMRCGK
jgi:hypothetical protein